ncbi:DUF4097 family beta strand repeat-containing protein [Larkinella soli]|uniref:DUF4097 family beta strand repeat-containing protein n=1 Tax=Larkinella soli TaxID=1770527 RepID=UPI000FFB5B55|nr:DUF4097 family beta strand repeat-containing protein [Larkinella soli]
MDRIKNLFNVLIVGFLSVGFLRAEDISAAERKKTIVKVYDVSQKDNLVIENQFGNVNINLWSRDEIRVDITITANSSSDERVQRFLDAVEIIEKRNGDQIMLKTQIERNGMGQNGNWIINKNKDGEKNFVQIDYQVSMPKGNALTVKNSFGNTTIPTFRAPLTVNNQYGNFYATELVGSQNTIDVRFGKAEIRQIENGKLNIQYSKLQLDKANVLNLNNQFGALKIGEVNVLDGNIGYSGALIGLLKESCRMKLNFSGSFKIEQMNKSADNVDIQANYSSVVLPIAESSDANFDVTVSYGGFKYPSDPRFVLTAQPAEDDNRHGPKFTKQYSGKMGKGNGTKVRVVATFGDVKFQ